MAKRSRHELESFLEEDFEERPPVDFTSEVAAKRHTSFKRPDGADEPEMILETVMEYDSHDDGSDSQYEFEFVDDNAADDSGDELDASSQVRIVSKKTAAALMAEETKMPAEDVCSDSSTVRMTDSDLVTCDASEDTMMEATTATLDTTAGPRVEGSDDSETAAVSRVSDLKWDSDDAMESDHSDKGSSKQSVWLPQYGVSDEQCDAVEYASSAYTVLHRMHTDWPCLSFDVLRDELGDVRTKTPLTVYLATGTQAPAAASGRSAKGAANTVKLLKVSQLQKTLYDSDSEDGDDSAEDCAPVVQSREVWQPSAVNRIRSMGGERPHVLATLGEDSRLRIFDVKQQLLSLDGAATDLSAVSDCTPAAMRSAKRTLRKDVLVFEDCHKSEGYGLGWDKVGGGRLATGNCVGQLLLYAPTSAGGAAFRKVQAFKTPKASIEDVVWSPSQASVFVTCGTDRSVSLWDCRQPKLPAKVNYKCHADDVNVVDWNPFNQHLIVSGSDDNSFRVWDLRKFSAPKKHARKRGSAKGALPYAHYQWHSRPVTSVHWHPFDESSLIASSDDNQISLWDLSLEEDAADAKDTAVRIPAQLMFVHAQKAVKEVAFHKQIPNLAIATGQSGFHFFKPDNLDDAFERLSIS